MSGNFYHIGIAILAAVPMLAGESAVLANGFRLHADRHEIAGNRVKLFTGDGFTELPLADIASFEPDYEPPKPPDPAPVPAQTVAAAVNVAPANPLDPQLLAAESAKSNNLPEALIRSIMHVESGFQPNAVSPKGAIGLMQLMPGTAQELHADAHDPRQNVEAGTAYLRSLIIKYENQNDGVARAVAAYNAGPAAVDRYNGVPPYRETQDYVYRVLTEYQKSLKVNSR